MQYEIDYEKLKALITFGSMIAAIISAVYATRKVKEAKRQNEIAIHNERLKIFKAILELKGDVVRRGVDIIERDLFANYYEYVKLSEFYYSNAIHEQINDYFKTVWDMASYHNLYNEFEGKKEQREYGEKAYKLLGEGREKFDKLEIIMKEQLRLVKPNHSLKKYLGLAEIWRKKTVKKRPKPS